MPVHDWTKVEAGVFHDFHHLWITSIRRALNSGVLPPDYYAMADQVAGPGNPDVLALQRRPAPQPVPRPVTPAAVAIADVARQVRFHDRATSQRRVTWRPKRVAVRHKTGDRVVALIEIVSPNNKSSRAAIRSFAEKLTVFISDGIHLLVLDVFPPGPRDPHGVHPLIWGPFNSAPFELPADKPLTLAAYTAGPVPEMFVDPVAVGDSLPDMPLFLTPDDGVKVPLEATYQAAWEEVPARWREVLEPPPMA
jgi:hypothetical protein